MKRIILIIIFILLNSNVGQAFAELSAFRELDSDFSVYVKTITNPSERSPLRLARTYNEENLPRMTSWFSIEEMQANFEYIRDFRYFKWKDHPKKLRRISWKFPDDGCFARASLAMKYFDRWDLSLPNKIFVFGNLKVKTKNSPNGVVGWWFHVAPIVDIDGIKYVLDPSIEQRWPLTLKDWLMQMGKPENMKVAICSSGTYSPGDNCDKKSDGRETRAVQDLQVFLGLEWNRMVSLGRENEL